MPFLLETGFGLGDVMEEDWNDWNKDRNAAERQAELEAVVQLAADQFRQQVEAVVCDEYIHGVHSACMRD